MAIGERIRWFRTKLGMTQKYLGVAAGLPESNADIRMAQYEAGMRTPKADLTKNLADALDVSPLALNVPDMDTLEGLMHTLFALEDLYGLTVCPEEGDVRLRIDPYKGIKAVELHRMLTSWQEQAIRLKKGEITQEEYDHWRYHFPQTDTHQIRANVPSMEIGDLFTSKPDK